MSFSAYRNSIASLQKSKEQFIATRILTVQRLRECAARLERSCKLCKAGVIGGKATIVGGGVMTVAGTATCMTLGASAPCSVPLLVAGTATAAVGSAVKSGCRYTLRLKNKRRLKDIEEALQLDDKVTSTVVDDLIRMLTFSKTSILFDVFNITSDVLDMAQALQNCAPEQMIELSELIVDISGINGADLYEFSTPESMFLSLTPGLDELLLELGVLEVGSDGVIELIAELIIGDVLPLRSILLPVHIVSLLRGAHRFSKKTYLRAALSTRQLAEKLENDGVIIARSIDAIVSKLLSNHWISKEPYKIITC